MQSRHEETLSRKLSTETGIKLCALDLIEYKKNSSEEYSKKHADLMDTDNWIIEGLGTLLAAY